MRTKELNRRLLIIDSYLEKIGGKSVNNSQNFEISNLGFLQDAIDLSIQIGIGNGITSELVEMSVYKSIKDTIVLDNVQYRDLMSYIES